MQCREETLGRLDETALALDRLDDDGGELFGADVLLDVAQGTLGGLLAIEAIAQRVGHGSAVNIGREGAEAGLVRLVLGGHGHGEIGAAVEGTVKNDDAVLAGVVTGNLYGILNSLRTGGEEYGLFVVGTRGQLVELLCHLDEAFVRCIEEARVGEVAGGLGHGLGYALVGRTHAGDGNARCEVDEGVAVDIEKNAAVTIGDVGRVARDDAGSDFGFAGGVELLAARARNCSGDVPLLREAVGEILHVCCLLVMLGGVHRVDASCFYDVRHCCG